MHLQIALDGVVYCWSGVIVLSHEFADGNVADGRLVVGLLGIHHHSHTTLTGNLRQGGKREEGRKEMRSERTSEWNRVK